MNVIILIPLILLSIAVCYLFFLALIAVSKKKQYGSPQSNLDLLILVPAHNEEFVIPETLKSLLKIKNTGKLDIAVIADNCDDKTAEVADSFGVLVLERFDTTKIGKGFALNWALSQVDLKQYDAVAIIDADTLVDSNMALALSESIENGYDAVQLTYEFKAVQKTQLSYLQEIVSNTENHFFYKARSALRLAILLRGSGMAIKASTLIEYPWNSFSITEDVDYGVNLLNIGKTVDFNVNSAVYSAATSSYNQSASQRVRWATGTNKLIFEKFTSIILNGIKKRNLKLIELAFSLLLLSRPMMIYFTLFILGLNLIFNPQDQSLFFIWGAIIILLLVVYNTLGIVYVKEKGPAFKSLLSIPVYGIWFLMVQILSLIKSGSTGWVRTRRENEK